VSSKLEQHGDIRRARRSRGVNKDPFEQRAPANLVCRQSIDNDHRRATSRTGPRREWRSFLVGGGRERLTRGGLKSMAAAGKVVGSLPIRQKAKEADPDEPEWQHVQEKPPQEFVGADREGPHLAAVTVVLPPECDRAVRDVDDPMVGDGDAVRVPGQVLEHVRAAAEGGVGIHDPSLAKEGPQERPKGVFIGQPVEVAGKRQGAVPKRLGQASDKLAAKHSAQHLDWEEE
jgi:hypothetical protein